MNSQVLAHIRYEYTNCRLGWLEIGLGLAMAGIISLHHITEYFSILRHVKLFSPCNKVALFVFSTHRGDSCRTTAIVIAIFDLL